jgi:hypothetical protein
MRRSVSLFTNWSGSELMTDRDAMDYFRAVSAAEEYSERALELTETIIRQNPAHYTVW